MNNSANLVKEIGQPMYDSLFELKQRFKRLGWSDAKCCQELTSADRVVIEAKDSSGHTHWIQVGRDGDIAPCVTCMRCK